MKLPTLLTTVLALTIALADGRTPKSSLMVTPDGWQALTNLTNSTVIVASNGRRLIGFDESACDDKHGHGKRGQNLVQKQDREDLPSTDRYEKDAVPPRSNPVIGFNSIPVIDLNGTAHLLRDTIVPVSTLAGDIIYTTSQALAPIQNTTRSNTSTSTSSKRPLDRYRLRHELPNKVMNATISNGEDNRRPSTKLSNSTIDTGKSKSIPSDRRNTTNDINSFVPSSSRPGTSMSWSGRSPSMDLAEDVRRMSNDGMESVPAISIRDLGKDPRRMPNDMMGLISTTSEVNDPRNDIMGPVRGISNGDEDVDTGGVPVIGLDDILNDVLSPILSSTSLWAIPSYGTDQADMVYIPVDTGDLFQGDVIFDTDQDPSILQSLSASHDQIIPIIQQLPKEPQNSLPVGVASPEQLRLQGQMQRPILLGDDEYLPAGIASPEQLLLQQKQSYKFRPDDNLLPKDDILIMVGAGPVRPVDGRVLDNECNPAII